MGNVGGVRKRGLTAKKVMPVVQEVLKEWFSDDVYAEWYGDSGGIVFKVKGSPEDVIFAWWDHGSPYTGLVGGKHPRLGPFGYWLLSVAELETAKRLKARVFDEGVGYYSAEEVERGPSRTFAEYLAKQPSTFREATRWLDRKLAQNIIAQYPALEKYAETEVTDDASPGGETEITDDAR